MTDGITEIRSLTTLKRNSSCHLDAEARIRLGLAQASKGEGRPAEEVFDELLQEDSSAKN
jgi:hypothetical protein